MQGRENSCFLGDKKGIRSCILRLILKKREDGPIQLLNANFIRSIWIQFCYENFQISTRFTLSAWEISQDIYIAYWSNKIPP